MIWADILSEIRRSLKEPTTGGHWTDAEFLRRANIVQRKIVRYTGCLKTINTSLVSIPGTASYTKPTNILRITGMYFGTNRIWGIPKEELNMQALQMGITDWTATDGTPTNYWEDFTSIGLYPKPNSTGTVIAIEGVIKPNDLINTADIPYNAQSYLEDYHDLLVSGVVYQCMLEDQNELFTEHKNNYVQGMESLRREMLNKPDTLGTFDLIRMRTTGADNKKPLPFMR